MAIVGRAKYTRAREISRRRDAKGVAKIRDYSQSRISIVLNQWIVFFAHSDWLLKLGISICYSPPGIFLFLRARFPSFLRKKELFVASYPLVWYIQKQLFTLASVKSGRWLPHLLVARQIFTTIHLHFGSTSV